MFKIIVLSLLTVADTYAATVSIFPSFKDAVSPNVVTTTSVFKGTIISGADTWDRWDIRTTSPTTLSVVLNTDTVDVGNMSATFNSVGSSIPLLATTDSLGMISLTGTFNAPIGTSYLDIRGTSTATYAYNGTVSIGTPNQPLGAVPVPGAVWLFGSALVGLMGLSRKKAK